MPRTGKSGLRSERQVEALAPVGAKADEQSLGWYGHVNGRKRALPTLGAVARKAGVSASTASRVLNSAPGLRVREETRQVVKAAALELNYVPNSSARSLRLSRAGAIGLMVDDPTNPIYGAIVQGARAEASLLGLTVVLLGEESLARNLSELLRTQRLDGLMVLPSTNAALDLLQEMEPSPIPLVLVDELGRGGYPGVALPDAAGTRLATEHLIRLGHRRIGFLGGAPSARAERRASGFRGAMEDAGLAIRREWLGIGGWNPAEGRVSARRLLSSRSRPSAVVVANGAAGVGALAGAADAGLRLPEDLSIAAVNDLWVAEYVRPTLTAVRMPMAELGREAVRATAAAVEGERLPDLTIGEPGPELIVRNSTAPFGKGEPCT
ncbi:MAG: LacI family DNA-binding transcriptional regulator [Chloroflexota bacterium]